MPSYVVNTPQRKYEAIVERGILARAGAYIPEGHGKVFVITTRDVWDCHGFAADGGTGEAARTRCSSFRAASRTSGWRKWRRWPSRWCSAAADRSSVVIAFGGGIVGDVAGFMAAVFMRGIPVIQVPTTLLAQVDAAVGGKTGVNLVSGKNLVGAFHQPLAVLIDPDVLETLPEREYRAGLYEIVKCGVIRSPELFALLAEQSADVLARKPEMVDRIIAEAVRIKAEVVTADEREGDLRAF